jgi:PhnB protein
MAKVNTYLNFPRNTEEAFKFYKSVFGGEFIGGISRFSEIPPSEDQPSIPEADKNLVMHIALPILDGHVLMGMDSSLLHQFSFNEAVSIVVDCKDQDELVNT